MGWEDNQDTYLIDVQRGDLLLLNVSFYNSYGLDACFVTPSGGTSPCARPALDLRWTANETGTWILQINRLSGFDPYDDWGGDYHLQVTAVAPPVPNDCGSGLDAGDGVATALALEVPGSCVGHLNDQVDQADWYAVDLPRGTAFYAALAPTPDLPWWTPRYLCLMGPDGVELFGCAYRDGFYFSSPADGTYYVKVFTSDHQGTGHYELNLVPASPQNDCETGMDATFWNAWDRHLQLPVSCSGTIAPQELDSYDAYSFEGPTAARVTFSFQGDARPQVCLWASTQTSGGACARATRANQTFTFPYQAQEPSSWSLTIHATGPSASFTYTVEVEAFTPTPQNDCNAGHDAGDTWASQLPLPDGTCAGDLVGTEGDYADDYVFTTSEPQNLTLDIAISNDKPIQICLHNASTWRCASGNGTATLQIHAPEAGEWHLYVTSHSISDGHYEVTLARSA